MAKPPHSERLLILTKTYPAPSTKHREISCVAAVNEDGRFRRLYPVPFRLLEGEQKFKRWEWIEANRFPDQWLIVGLAYPPRQRPIADPQLGLKL